MTVGGGADLIDEILNNEGHEQGIEARIKFATRNKVHFKWLSHGCFTIKNYRM